VPPPDKVIVTNQSALRTKYGDSYTKKIKPALDALVAADKARGITTLVVYLDDARSMTKYKGPKVTSATDLKKNKQAIDAVYRALTPAYLCILGAVDIVPHQILTNPAPDDDATVPSDLPYACEAAFSKEVRDFVSPTRVVGRLPDLTGSNDAAYFVTILKTASTAQSRPASEYSSYLGVTAAVWEGSTKLSLQAVFGDSSDLQIVPPAGPPWTNRIQRLAHFINCHGAPADPHFYGQSGNSFPIAHDATQLAGLADGTVIAAECCYGAELYNPSHAGGQAGICNTSLKLGAYGFFGSSTIAYGPADSNSEADLICQFFFRSLLAGASLGEAVLKARQDYLAGLAVASPYDLKTLAQFNLMGDPSVHPVAALPHGMSVMEGVTSKSAAKAVTLDRPAKVQAASRSLRRGHLASLGMAIGNALPTVRALSQDPPPTGIRSVLEAELSKVNAQPERLVSFEVASAQPQAKRRGLAAVSAEVDAIHVAVGELPRENAPFKRLYVVVALQQATNLMLRYLHSR
jgi:hypothetical protein